MHNTISSPCNAIENVILPKCHYNTPTGNIYQEKSWSNMHPPPLIQETERISQASHHKTEREYWQTQCTRYAFSTSKPSTPLLRKGQGNVRLLRTAFSFLLYILFMLCKRTCSKHQQYFWISASAARAKMLEWKTIKEGFQNCIAKIHETLIPNFAVHTHPREASSNNICFIYCSDQTKRACIFYKHYY